MNGHAPVKPLTSRTMLRLLLAAAFLVGVLTWRLDQAVRTAYKTNWVPFRYQAVQQANLLRECPGCPRLPSDGWVWVYTAGTVLAFVFLLLAVLVWRLRAFRGQPSNNDLDRFLYGATVAVLVTAVGAAVGRRYAAVGSNAELVTLATMLTLVALACIVVQALAIATVAGSKDRTGSLLTRLRRLIQRQRINLLGVTVLTIALLLVAQTSGQAIDSIRTWGITSAHGGARLGFGFATALLLALVLYESGLRLNQSRAATRANVKAVPWPLWLTIGVVLIEFGIVAAAYGPVGYGPIVLGGIAVLLGLLELPRLPAGAGATHSGLEVEQPPDERGPEYIAIVPLLAIAATSVAAAVDASLSGGVSGNTLAGFIPALLLAGAAVVMTSEGPAPQLNSPSLRIWLLIFGLMLAASLVVVLLQRASFAAVVGYLCCVVVVVYAVMLFHPPARAGALTRVPQAMLSLPIAAGAGVAVFAAVHLSTRSVSVTLGTFALVNVSLAFILTLMHFAVRASLLYRPPRLLWWFGLEQLPLVTIILLAWIGAGLIGSPETLHDARLSDREAVLMSDGQPTSPLSPTLEQAFVAWTQAQPELASQQGQEAGAPVPLVLVAAHGGGIRAAYWTALVLDCVVGVSSERFSVTALAANDALRTETCKEQRRSAEGSRAAARRIFLASGVSGGAVGLYAYARQLLTADLGDGGWVDRQLGRDYASATVGWALFHDIPNRFLGLNPQRGGGCGWRFFGTCLTNDRAAVLEDDFDHSWGGETPMLRHTWDARFSGDTVERGKAQTVPLLLTNATVTGGKARAVVSAADLGAWPLRESGEAASSALDPHPLAGTVEVADALCFSRDIRLSTAAFLGARFPYVSPSGHLSGRCGRSAGAPLGADRDSRCAASAAASTCETRLVDGGYADNSGLFTIGAIWPTLRDLIVRFNSGSNRKIAPVIIELDNHYVAGLDKPLPAGGTKAESLLPLTTAFGARESIQTYARAQAFRLLPPSCVVTIAPGLHPGLTAPLGWELSRGARDDLEAGLVRPPPRSDAASRNSPVYQLRRLQQWLGSGNEKGEGLTPGLTSCIPR